MNKEILEAYKNYMEIIAKDSPTGEDRILLDKYSDFLEQLANKNNCSLPELINYIAVRNPIYEVIFSMDKIPHSEDNGLVELNGSNHAMIDTLCDELSDYQYQALCNQLK